MSVWRKRIGFGRMFMIGDTCVAFRCSRRYCMRYPLANCHFLSAYSVHTREPFGDTKTLFLLLSSLNIFWGKTNCIPNVKLCYLTVFKTFYKKIN